MNVKGTPDAAGNENARVRLEVSRVRLEVYSKIVHRETPASR